MAVDWAELPPELLRTVAEKLTRLIDYIRFRAVCVNWRSSSPNTPHCLPCQLPWLMLPHNRTHLHLSHRRAFFSLSANKVHTLNLPEASHSRRRCGSSHGWLVVLDESPAIFLLNPLTRSKVNLPPLSSFPNVSDFNFYDVGREYSLLAPNGDTYTSNLKEMRDSFIKKVILSSSPSSNCNYIALAILSQTGDLAFCKEGDQSWKFIDGAQHYHEDAIFSDGLFYAVNKLGQIAVCDLHGTSPRVSFIHTPPQIGGEFPYLVSSLGELLLVTRYIDINFANHQFDIVYRTTQFRVYKLDIDIDIGGPKWERVTSLGDQMLFLGENSSLAMSATDFPGCKGNCIYFTDDYSESNYDGFHGDHDLGIYNLEDGAIEPLPNCFPHNSHTYLRWTPPIWLTPNIPC